MRIHGAGWLRNHWHVILIVPLVIIVITWPTFARIFDADEFWLYGGQRDRWLDIWNAWHVERVLAGQADYYYTDTIFHPQGLSLAFQHIALPHALLLIVFKKFMPLDDAYNALYLLMLCFNALSGYVLIQHLIGDKWIALFGAAVFGISPHFIQGTTVPDIILIGTYPLAIYCFHRSVMESRWLFAALAGICAGISTFIGMYTFVITLLTLGIYGFYLSLSRWRQAGFWRHLLLFLAVCGLISILRVYPMIADASALHEGLHGYQVGHPRSHDVLHYFVPARNPFTEDWLRALFQVPPAERHNSAYLGYINLFFLACAILLRPRWRKLLPWLTVLAFFAVLRLGHYLTFHGNEFTNIVLPDRVLSEWFPAVFGAFVAQEYYQPGLILSLAVLACFGLAAILKAKPAAARFAVVLISTLILSIEFYVPRGGRVVDPIRTEYINWLQSETDDSIKLINLPREVGNPHYFMYLQTLTGYSHADGFSSRSSQSARRYINGNLLLSHWDSSRSVHCLPHNEQTFLTALDRLLEDGFTHVIVHNELFGDQFINHSFWNVPPSYDDHFVSVYRLRDLRLSCDSKEIELSQFRHFAELPSAFPGRRSSILSFHPSDRIDEDLFTYLDSLFSDWQSLLHLYLDGELAIQSAGTSYPDMSAFARDNQVFYLIYNRRDMGSAGLPGHLAFDGFNLCQREEHEDGSVIEHYLSREFSCGLITSSQPLQVDYDNGARLVYALVEVTQDVLEIQVMWSSLPTEPHSVSLQVFDGNGAKVLGQDSTIGDDSLAQHRIDISALPPGDYTVKLIVYNYETRRSVPGAVSRTGERFEREFVITDFTRS